MCMEGHKIIVVNCGFALCTNFGNLAGSENMACYNKGARLDYSKLRCNV